MKTATQSEIRSWARAQGIKVNARGSLPTAVTAAYAAASSPQEGTKRMPTATTKRTGRKPASPATGRQRSPGRTATAKAPSAPRARVTSRAKPTAATTKVAAAHRAGAPAHIDAPAAGSIDLAGGLRSYLDSVQIEVLAVSALSERIDELVVALNAARAEQATRLLVLDALREAFSDAGQFGFLDKLIKPRPTRITEVVPARLAAK
jgi:hypothetical protein